MKFKTEKKNYKKYLSNMNTLKAKEDIFAKMMIL